jgi:hypothetical protein
MSVLRGQAPHRKQASLTIDFRPGPLPQLAGERLWIEGKQGLSCVLVFLLVMAAISLVRVVGEGLIGSAFLAWFGVPLDPFMLSAALHLVVTLIGIGVAGCFSRVTLDSTARRHMLLTPVAAMGAGLLLVGLGYFVGDTSVSTWPIALVYILWAWMAAVSAA